MINFFLFFISLTISFCQTCSQDVNWCFDVSTIQSFYLFSDVNIDGTTIESGSVPGSDEYVYYCPNNDCDIIGAFYNNICIGWTYPYFNTYYTVPIMMNDGNLENYIVEGEIPEFRLYDRSSGTIYTGLVPNDIEPCNNFEINIVNYLESGSEYFETVQYDIHLFEGHNLVSFHSLDDNSLVSDVMSPLGANAISVIGEGIVASNLSNGLWVGSLTELDRTKGYWVTVLNNDTLRVTAKVDSMPEITVYYGNNLISFPIDDTLSIEDALPDNVEDKFSSIIGEGLAAQNINNNNQINDEVWFGSLTHFESKKGYWVQIIDDSLDLVTPVFFSFDSSNELMFYRSYQKYKESPFPFEQSIYQAFYFVDSIDNVEDGDWIVAYNNSVIVGSRQWNGPYTDIPVMGSYDESSINYCNVGDIPDFYLYDSNFMLKSKLSGFVPTWHNNGVFNVSFNSDHPILANDFEISAPFPNPFNPIAKMDYFLPNDTKVFIELLDIKGRQIAVLVDKLQIGGSYGLHWDGSDFSSGIYILNYFFNNKKYTQKLVLLK